ncbi:MAG: DUF3800 domain-containing protein [Methanosarcinaceae archaeon]
MNTTHIAYSDESKHNTGRYRSISMVSMPADRVAEITLRIKTKLIESDVNEAKWSKVKNARNRFAAIKLLSICSEETYKKNMRLDVLIWDTEDERHKLPGRDDLANFKNMYIQLLKNVMRKRWSMDATWQFFPDENSIIDWKHFRNILANTNRFTNKKANLFTDEWRDISHHFNILEIAEVSSKETMLVQIADIFAGIGVFSYERHAVYEAWKRQNSEQIEMFPSKPVKFTKKEEEQSLVFHHFLQNSAKYRLEISNKEGLRTYNPANPINFWLYQPQRKSDKAPRRKKK